MSNAQLAPSASTVSLSQALEDIHKVVQLCLDNDFDEAKAICVPYESNSMYHSVGLATLYLVEAMFTFEREKFADANKQLEKTLEMVEKCRKHHSLKESLTNIFSKPVYTTYTELEVHAELCYCECLMYCSVVAMMEDEAFGTLIKSALRMRTSFQHYKHCREILKIPNWENWSTKDDFQTGVDLGMGSFNLIISILPPKVIKLLEFVGFSGDKQYGLTTLKSNYDKPGLRQPFCIMVFTTYELILVFLLSYFIGDIADCELMLDKMLLQHKNGAIFLFLKGRLELIKGNVDDAITWYKNMISSQKTYPQVNCFPLWDLAFIYSLRRDYKTALQYTDNILEISQWSKCIYYYQKAILMLMTNDDKSAVDQLMKEIPGHKQKIMGKHIPAEKFAIRKSDRYFAQSKQLYLPVYEFLYIWNYFKLLENNVTDANAIISDIDEKLTELEVPEPLTRFDNDNKAVLYMLKGVCLRHIGELDGSLENLEKVLLLEKQVVSDVYVIPFTRAEIALVYYHKGDKTQAIKYFEEAKRNYSGYNLEHKLHFRIQSALAKLQS